MAAVDLVDVRKNFGAFEVIRGVSIDVEDGAFVSLVGPSGCGKSTLLRLLAGLEDITAGRIVIGGRLVNKVRAKDRDIAMVFQNYALYPHMTVGENMGFALFLRGDKQALIDERVKVAAEILGLTPLLDRLPGQLSGGQRQRVAMGRAIVRDPKVFLFDEPLSNLDAKLRVQMRGEIKALHQRLGTTTVYVTHDQVEAMTMSSKIVVLRDGKVEQSGAPLQLYDHPANIFVAEFIGSPAMNLLRGRLAGDASAPRVELTCGASLPVPFLADGASGREVFAGIRPEHLVLDDNGPIAATLEVLEPTGNETVLCLATAAESLTALSRDRHDIAPGETVRLRPLMERIHIFDAQSGERLARMAEA